MGVLSAILQKYLYWISFPKIGITDIVEIIIISFLIYQILGWIKTTRAWVLLKGIIVVFAFAVIAMLFQLNTILWIASKTINVGIIAVIVVFQPELRRALEQLGRKKILGSVFSFDEQKEQERFSEKTISEVIRAAFEMGKTKTGALIVMEKEVVLGEYERTGIPVDAMVSSQLLINIFEHNTPLHDGAVIIRHNRIAAATCYLPLTDSLEVNKELGTRHRAGIGISEVSDSVTIIVSEETGKVSITVGGKIIRNVDGDMIRGQLTQQVQKKTIVPKGIKFWKGSGKNEGKITK